MPALSGDTRHALDEPNTVVITASTAQKYFGPANALGKALEIDKKPYKITAVIKDIPQNSHFHFDFMLSMKNVDYGFGNFLSHNFQTYIVLRPGTDYHDFEKNFTQIVNNYIFPQAKQFMSINSMDDFYKAGNQLQYHLMPLTDIHLKVPASPNSIRMETCSMCIFSGLLPFYPAYRMHQLY